MTSFSGKIRQFARGIGFDLIGFTPAVSLPEHQKALESWLQAGYGAEMAYMSRDPARRANPRHSLPGAKTVICLALNYYPGDHPEEDSSHVNGGVKGRISRYAWGRDYHHLIEEKLDRLTDYLRGQAGLPIQVKRYVDYGPVLERALAARAGLGFIGKNTLLITQEFGSWVFLAELITDIEIMDDDVPAPGGVAAPHCGSCTLCIEACPTGAIVAPFQLDAARCISYLTIENKGEIAQELKPQVEDWVFGCDVCQEVCPYNRQTPLTQEEGFFSGAGPWMDLEEVQSLDEETFKARLGRTPLHRPRLYGLKRNAQIVAQNLTEVSDP